jgi:DNA-binding XRE family transcriptional regulator
MRVISSRSSSSLLGRVAKKMNVCVSQTMATLTAAQCRAARALVDWTQEKLGAEAEVSPFTIRNFEGGKTSPNRATLEVLRRALEAAGVEFLGDRGVQLK